MKSTIILAAIILPTSVVGTVETGYSPPVGGVTITLAGAVNGVPKLTTFTPLLRMPVASSFAGKHRGKLSSVASTSFVDASSTWDVGALSQAAAPYFVRMRSGNLNGTWWQISTSSGNTATSVSIVNRGIDPVAAGLASGDAYEIVPADTLATLFGEISAVAGGPTATTADTVQLHDGANWREYYYNTTVGQWREGTSSFNRSNTIIRPETGIVYVRRGAGDLKLVMLGNVSITRERVAVYSSGVTPVGNVFPVVRTLGSLALHSMPGFVPYVGNMDAADKVSVFDGVNWRKFHYNQSAGQWREGTSSFNRNTYALPFGAPVVIERGAGATGAAVFLTLDPPYSL